MASHDYAISILYAALAEPIGIILHTSDPVAAKMKLYSAKRKSGDAALDELQIKQSPQDPSELLIVNRRIRTSVVKEAAE